MMPSVNHRRFRAHCLSIACLLGCLWLTGCSDMLPVMTPFGAVSSPDQYRSINGLGVHRRMWETAGAKVLSPQKLSPKLETFDVIVLVGQSFEPPGRQARQWLEEWLAAAPGRTVIYFGRDFNAEVYYRQQTLPQLPEDDQARAEQLLAMTRVAELRARIGDLPESTFCGWFFLDVDAAPRRITAFQGDWNGELGGLAGNWPTGVLLQPPHRRFKSRQPSWLTGTAPPLNLSSTIVLPENSQVSRSVWSPDELGTQEAWNEEFRDLPRSQTLLASADGQPLIFRLTHPRKFPDSQILVVANGAPLLNGSLVEPLHQRLGEKLIAETLPAKRVALLSYDSYGLLISQTPEADPRGAGLEMLMVWPLSAITMPAALLGIIVCAALLPILGRAQRLPPRSVSDFGLHIEALGRMLMESRDVEFAKSAVDEYFHKVRGESPPPWLEELGHPPSPVAGEPPPVRTP